MDITINLLSDDDSRSSINEDKFSDLPKVDLPRVRTRSSDNENRDDNVLDLTQDTASSVSNATVSTTSEKMSKRLKRKSVGSTENKLKKSNAALLRESKKQRLAEKRTANEINKIYKPGECMKYMTIELHPALSDAWYMADLSRELSSSGVKVTKTSSLCDPALLMWSRCVPPKLTSSNGQVNLTPLMEPCKRALYITTLEEILDHINGHTLAKHIIQIRDLSDSNVTLVVFGVKEYFKPNGRKKNNNNKIYITEIELEMALTDLIVSANADAVCVNTPNELALLIVQYTKAIAEEPYKLSKRACEEQAEFYMRGDNKKCLPIDKDGNGVARVWQQMIAILPLSSLETSRAICGQYKSPLALYEAVQSPNSVNELADIGVARAAVPGSKARRVGPEFARKLHLLFTADDGNVLLG